MNKRVGILSLVMVSSLAFVGCSRDSTAPKEHNVATEEHEDHMTESGDVRQTTSSVEELPGFLTSFPDEMSLIYTAAASHKELLENIPCYCGCGESANHKNNYDCFIHKNKSNGAIVWDDHATKCGVCLEIAAQSVNDYENGATVKEIRTKIDEKYKEGYAKPTPTKKIS